MTTLENREALGAALYNLSRNKYINVQLHEWEFYVQTIPRYMGVARVKALFRIRNPSGGRVREYTFDRATQDIEHYASEAGETFTWAFFSMLNEIPLLNGWADPGKAETPKTPLVLKHKIPRGARNRSI